jgi:hypothetical protein
MDIINNNISQIIELCKDNKVTELYVFGSILTSKFSLESDIDMIVKIESDDPLEYSENYFNLKYSLETLLRRKIDLLEEKSINNETFKHLVNLQKHKIYDREGQSVA